MYDIDIFNNIHTIIKRKINPYINIYIAIMIIILSIFIIFSIKYEYTNKYKIKGQIIIEDNKYFIRTYIEEEKIEVIYNELVFNNIKIKFKIKSLGNEYLIDNNSKKYYEVNLLFELDNPQIRGCLRNSVLNPEIILKDIIKTEKNFNDYIIEGSILKFNGFKKF